MWNIIELTQESERWLNSGNKWHGQKWLSNQCFSFSFLHTFFLFCFACWLCCKAWKSLYNSVLLWYVSIMWNLNTYKYYRGGSLNADFSLSISCFPFHYCCCCWFINSLMNAFKKCLIKHIFHSSESFFLHFSWFALHTLRVQSRAAWVCVCKILYPSLLLHFPHSFSSLLLHVSSIAQHSVIHVCFYYNIFQFI